MRTKSVFSCSSCGYQSPKWLGRCPDCNRIVGGEPNSAHKKESNSNGLSCAGDFQVRADTLSPIMDAFKRRGVTRFGIYRPSGKEGYLHADNGKQGDNFVQNRIWTY